MSPETIKRIDELADIIRNCGKEMKQVWAYGILFTWQWWLLLALTVLPWIFWIFYHRKDSTNRLLYAGFFSIIVAKLLDTLGASFGLWEYTARVIPLVPPLLPWDTTLMPVAVMTFIQFKPKLSPYIKAIVFGAFAAFVIEEAAERLGLYRIIAWKHIYSFPIFIVIYLAADWISKRARFARVDT